MKKYAFAMAEVLITLGIIGIVAAMTLPALIGEWQVKRTVAQLKKINTTLQNAFNLLKTNEYGGENVQYWNITSSEEFTNKLAKYLNAQRVCPSNSKKCFHDKPLLPLHKVPNYETTNIKNFPGIILNDGLIIQISLIINNSAHIDLTGDYGQIFVDLNGSKQPNTLGRDVFSFYIKNNKIIPRGIITEDNSMLKDHNYELRYCSVKNGVGHNGLGCTAWVIYNENMDYLKCEGLNWYTKKTCK